MTKLSCDIFYNHYISCFTYIICTKKCTSDALPSTDSLEIKSKLKNQLFKPVQWVDTMNHIKNYDGIVIECGPGRVLTGLAKTNGLNNILSMVSPTFNDELQQLL